MRADASERGEREERAGVHEDCIRCAQKFPTEERGKSDAVFAVCRGGVRERAANGGGGVWERSRRRRRGRRRGDERRGEGRKNASEREER